MELQDSERPTPAVMLRKRMRHMREEAGLSLRTLADEIHLPFGFLGRVERGEQQATETLVKALDRRFDTAGLFADLYIVIQEASIPDYGRECLRREPGAIRIQVFTSSLIPGLLQTEDYARELFRTSPQASEEDVEIRLAVRMKRQRILDREDPPLYWTILDEAALKRPLASKKVMREQLAHLLQITKKCHISLQVLPFSAGFHPMPGGSLTLLTMKDGATIASVESFATANFVDAPKKVVEYLQSFDVARSMSLPEDQSLDLIRSYLREYENEADS